MGFFGKKEEKPFISNNSLVEIINSNDAYLNEGIDEKGYSALEKQLERRFLYRNVESVISTGNASLVIVKYKDLKVRYIGKYSSIIEARAQIMSNIDL